MKNIITLIILLICTKLIIAQDAKDVTLTEIGQGKTKDDSKYNALRNAIEKAYGTFISSETVILNDELKKDEIVSISNGNIKSFEILSETKMPDGSYVSVVKAIVSVTKLTSFFENKGITVEFKGGLFAANIKMQELNKKNEEAVFLNLYKVIKKITENLYDYTIMASEPIKYSNVWKVPLVVKAKVNNNINIIGELITNTIKGISLTAVEVENIKKQGSPVYKAIILDNNGTFYLRSKLASFLMHNMFLKVIPAKSYKFKLKNGLINVNGIDIVKCLASNIINNSCPFNSQEKYISCYYPLYFRFIDRPDESANEIWLREGQYAADNTKTAEKIVYYLKESQSNNYTDYTTGYDDSHLSEYFGYGDDFALYFKDALATEFDYVFGNILTAEQLADISEYKVEPIK